MLFNPMDVLKHITDLEAQLKNIAPHDWKGNKNGEKHHFDSIDRVDAGLVGGNQLWAEFDFTDAGVKNTVRVQLPAAQIGKKDGAQITLNGVDEDHEQLKIGPKVGFDSTGFYHRVAVEFIFTDKAGTKHDYRFDGSVG